MGENFIIRSPHQGGRGERKNNREPEKTFSSFTKMIINWEKAFSNFKIHPGKNVNCAAEAFTVLREKKGWGKKMKSPFLNSK